MPDGITIHAEGLGKFGDAITALIAAMEAATPVATEAAGEAVLARIRAHMDGPSPPKAGGEPPARISGNLIGSLRNERFASGFGTWGRKLYPDGGQAPYARRIELGFAGTDSIGRKYEQPGYPYFQPGLDEAVASGEITALFIEAWGAAFRV